MITETWFGVVLAVATGVASCLRVLVDGSVLGWGGIGALLFVFLGRALFLYVRGASKTRVVPMFRTHVPGATFGIQGQALSRHLEFLDGVAASAEVVPLSAYLAARTPRAPLAGPWFECADAMRTVTALQNATEVEPLVGNGRLHHELGVLAECLAKGVAAGARFRLIVLHGSTMVSPGADLDFTTGQIP